MHDTLKGEIHILNPSYLKQGKNLKTDLKIEINVLENRTTSKSPQLWKKI